MKIKYELEDVVKFLASLEVTDGPWVKYFNDKYCSNCFSAIANKKDENAEQMYLFCESHDNICREFLKELSEEDMIRIWLKEKILKH